MQFAVLLCPISEFDDKFWAPKNLLVKPNLSLSQAGRDLVRGGKI